MKTCLCVRDRPGKSKIQFIGLFYCNMQYQVAVPSGFALLNKTATRAKNRTLYTIFDQLVQIQNNYTKNNIYPIFHTPHPIYYRGKNSGKLSRATMALLSHKFTCLNIQKADLFVLLQAYYKPLFYFLGCFGCIWTLCGSYSLCRRLVSGVLLW